ncbi:MAG: hypothetical protein Q8L64_00750, partial [bacterium]|nr:hypothetical protein [bacterium]
MFSKIPFRRIFLLALIVSMILAITACNRKDAGVAPTTGPTISENQSFVSSKPSPALIEAATGPVNIDPVDTSISEAMPEVLFQNVEQLPKLPIKTSVAPNQQGPNLALSAFATADSSWPGGPWTPDKGNDGSMSTNWAARYWIWNHWYRLDWPQPTTINRIYITHQPEAGWGQTIQQIRYLDANTGSWVTIPGLLNYFYGGNTPAVVDFSFSPVTASAAVVYMNTGPYNPHPNWTVTIYEMEVYGPTVEVTSVTPYPSILLLDRAGAGSGIVFRAITSEAAEVTFKVRPSAGGAEQIIGSKQTIEKNSEHVAKLSWWGKLPGGSIASEGSYEIIAQVDTASQSTSFSIQKIDDYVINMGDEMKDGKDPAAVVPEDPKSESC